MRTWLSFTTITIVFALLLPDLADAGRRRRASHEGIGHLTWTSPQSEPLALSPDGTLLLVASTTSNQVDVIDTATQTVTKTIAVGMEPVSVAFKPDGSEAWVSNHLSDSVSVIDTQSASASFLEVVAIIQDVDANGVSQFDEPVGIAFSGNEPKAYVVLSSRNDVAVIDTTTRTVTNRLHITAQDPRAITWRNGFLYVAAFESGNQTQLSECLALDGTSQCTLTPTDVLTFISGPALPGVPQNIVIDTDLPDRDVFVFDTSNDQLVSTVSGVGTLLYGLAVDSTGKVYVAQTHARNSNNGLAAQPPLGLGQGFADYGGRMFLNQIGTVDCGGGNCGAPALIELEPLPPLNPIAGSQLGTPYGITVSNDDSTLIVTAAASSRLFAVNAAAGTVLDILDLGTGADLGQQIPRGVALVSNPTTGAPQTAYVLNTLENTVSVVDVSNPSLLVATTKIAVGNDPTPDAIRRGAIVFNSAQMSAASTETFSCASCHPDGNIDQLLWIFGSQCTFDPIGCDQEEPRSTMPIRGLRDSLPLHWDGTLADPFGGSNGQIGNLGTPLPASCTAETDCFDGFAAGGIFAFCGPTCPLPAGSDLDLAAFLKNVAYPPARSRPASDVVSATGIAGFEDFFMNQGGLPVPNTCADSTAGCHEFPFGASTNSETLAGFDAPTMRGMTDRFLQFSNGITSAEEILVASNAGLTILPPPLPGGPPNAFPWDPDEGMEETTTFGVAFGIFTPVYNVGPVNIFQMFEEASTGHSGATGRQVMLNTTTTAGCPACSAEPVLADLETADANGVVNLRGTGKRGSVAVTLSYLSVSDEYRVGTAKMNRAALLAEAQSGFLLASLTAHLRNGVRDAIPQPLLAPLGASCGTGPGATGDPALPTGQIFQIESSHVTASHVALLDGQTLPGATITLMGSATACPLLADGVVTPDLIQIDLGSAPGVGTHLLQVQSPAGLLSNEVPLP